MKLRLLPALALVAAATCTPQVRRLTAFSSRFADNELATISAVAQRLPAQPPGERPANALGAPVIAAVRQSPTRAVVLYDLAAGRQLWATDVNASSPPEVLGDLVVVGAGNQVVALDARTGQRRWAIDTRGLGYVGAAREGDTVVVVTSLGASGNGARVGRVIAVDAGGGGERWSHEVVGILGRPAVSAGYAFVPWDRQSIAVLDLAGGVERARLRATDDVLTWVFASPQGVFYGSRGAYRWTPRSASGTREGSAFLANPLENVPGDPPLYRDAFATPTGARTARDKIRFAFLPRVAEGNAMAVAHDTIYLAYYRFLVAVDARTGEVRWARAFGPDDASAAAGAGAAAPQNAEAARRAQAALNAYDIESVTVTPTSVVTVSGNGRVRALDPATGAILGGRELGADIAAITTDLGAYRPSGSDGAAPAPEGTPRDQLVALIRDPDNRLVPIRAYLVRLLARRPEQEVTRDLLELYRQRSIPGALRTEIATALRTRRNGAQFLVQALEGADAHYNYLENRQAPPLDVIAPTLAEMGAREAVPVLLQHMLDHETPAAWLPDVIAAIARLGDASAIPQLQAFLQRYKSDSAFAGENNAPLQAAAAGIFRLGDAQARQWLTAMSTDASAHEPLRASITRLFAEEAATGTARTQDQQLAAAREELRGRLNALAAALGSMPRQLSADAFDAEWSNHLTEIQQCVIEAITRRPNLGEVRINVRLRSELPAELFQREPPQVRLPQNASFEQRMADVQRQMQWAEQQINRVQSHQSLVRSVEYAPLDQQMRQCLNPIIQPLRFPGFGERGMPAAQQTFSRTIQTAQQQAAGPQYTPGFGTLPGNTSILVPWFLVSSPSIDPATGNLVAQAQGAGGGAGAGGGGGAQGGADAGVAAQPRGADAGVRAVSGADAGAAGAARRPDAGGQANQPSGRPWWEE